MATFKKILRVVLIILTAFLALTTFLGGIGLITGVLAMSTELLQGSLFKDYTIPGLSLSIIVGSVGLVACLLLIRRNKFAILASTTAGVVIMFFEFVEVLIIGSDPGVARTLQIFILPWAR
jgi:hypothetical protein